MSYPPGYGAPMPGYGAPMPGYGAPPPGYGAPAPGYGAPPPGYGAPMPSYGAPQPMPDVTCDAGYGGAPGYGGMPAVNPVAWAMFSAVDVDRSGNINERELQTALSHGGWLPFSIKTTRMLIKMFDVDRSDPSGTLSYSEFESLLNQMGSWRALFDSADTDRSGKLSKAEVIKSVRSLRFSCPDSVLESIFRAYDDDNSGNLAFDEYIRMLAELTVLTSAFRKYDPSGAGHATLNYNQFLEAVFLSRV